MSLIYHKADKGSIHEKINRRDLREKLFNQFIDVRNAFIAAQIHRATMIVRKYMERAIMEAQRKCVDTDVERDTIINATTLQKNDKNGNRRK